MAVIKLDDELYGKVRAHIKKGDHRFDFPTVKSFVDKAVYRLLKDEKKRP